MLIISHRLRDTSHRRHIIPMKVRDILTFFPSQVWGSGPQTDLQAKWLEQRVFCILRYFSYPLISRH